jgi:hypothetical protein
MAAEQDIKGNYAINWNVRHVQLKYYDELLEAQKEYLLAAQAQGNAAVKIKFLKIAFFTYYSTVKPLFLSFWEKQKHSIIKTYFPHIVPKDFDDILKKEPDITLDLVQAIIMWSQIDGPFATLSDAPDEYIW